MLFSGPQYVKKQDVCLYLTTPFDTKNDPNTLYWRIHKSMQDFSIFNSLCTCGSSYKVINKKVASIEEINQTIEQLCSNGNKIQSLWILAHGNPFEILLTNENCIDTNSIIKLKNSLQKLESKATIVLASCSTGYELKGKKPIAAEIAAAAPGRKVYAPRVLLFTRDVLPVVTKSKSLKAKFLCPWDNDNYAKKFIDSSSEI